MKWSRYNILFQSKRNGWMLFNTVSRAFLLVEDAQLENVRGIAADPEGFNYINCAPLYFQFRSMGFLVEDQADDQYYPVAKMRNLIKLYANSALSLTIAVTRACNFACSYCFEGNRTGKPMSQEVEDKLIAFIKRYQNKNMNLVWYGGEPLMAYERICSISRRLDDIGKNYTASIITNGSLLNDEIIANLNHLKIKLMQITLDGDEDTHNSRRYLVNGGKTYQTILKNVEKVLASSYKGMIHIRVNVDTRNEEQFVYVYRYFQQKYPQMMDKRIHVYPGFVKGDDHPDVSCFYDTEQQGAFVAKMYEKYGIPVLTMFPKRGSQGCTLTRRNAFVVGPDGELYKCWDDVGIPSSVVGTIDLQKNWNMPLLAEGMVSCSYLDDPECRECKYFPICDGGCHRIRMKNLHREEKHTSCSYFKAHIEELLELHYERKLKFAEKQKEQQVLLRRQQAHKAVEDAKQALAKAEQAQKEADEAVKQAGWEG